MVSVSLHSFHFSECQSSSHYYYNAMETNGINDIGEDFCLTQSGYIDTLTAKTLFR